MPNTLDLKISLAKSSSYGRRGDYGREVLSKNIRLTGPSYILMSCLEDIPVESPQKKIFGWNIKILSNNRCLLNEDLLTKRRKIFIFLNVKEIVRDRRKGSKKVSQNSLIKKHTIKTIWRNDDIYSVFMFYKQKDFDQIIVLPSPIHKVLKKQDKIQQPSLLS